MRITLLSALGFCTWAFLLGTSPSGLAQSAHSLPEFELERVDVETHVRVLAADAMMGRMPGTPGNEQAASYIAAHFAAYGLQPPPGQDDYFQPFVLRRNTLPEEAELVLGEHTFEQGKGMMLLRGQDLDLNARVVFAGYGWVDAEAGHDDYQGLDVEGALVVVLAGRPGQNDARTAFQMAAQGVKQSEAARRGAVGLIELARFRMNWPVVRRAISRPRIEVGAENAVEDNFPYAWVHEGETDLQVWLTEHPDEEARLTASSSASALMPTRNVAGMVEGVDPELKDEVVILSAHYDHVGAGAYAAGGGMTPTDSIFNGARDNALGVAALLSAARSLAQQPARRSVLFLAVSAEEMGMIGSQYYADHPLIPLEQTVFNINTDGAGYNDISKISVIGMGRTNMDDALEEGSRPFGLEIFPNPAPDQNLFERSDNISFARVGVPALTVSPGFTAFDEQIMRNYHQVTDEADSLDYGYVLRYAQTIAHMMRAVADASARPAWNPDDPYAP